MRTARHHGFTLLEVLIALLIFSLGILGLAALQTYSVKTNQSALFRSQATALASMLLDDIRANRSNVAAYYSNEYAAFDCTTEPADSPIATHDLESWRQQVNCALPQGRGSVAPIGDNEVAVCLRWSDARWETSDGSAEGDCVGDAGTFGAGSADGGSGAGTDGQFSVFVVVSRL
jgi:type IV pilus assembly protein PilV